MGRRWIGRALVIVFVAACTSPTLPLPPPALPTISSGLSPDTFHLASTKGAIPNSLIVCVNRNTAFTPGQRVSGTIADGDGTWELDVIGAFGDSLDVSQENGDERSAPVTVVLPSK